MSSCLCWFAILIVGRAPSINQFLGGTKRRSSGVDGNKEFCRTFFLFVILGTNEAFVALYSAPAILKYGINDGASNSTKILPLNSNVEFVSQQYWTIGSGSYWWMFPKHTLKIKPLQTMVFVNSFPIWSDMEHWLKDFSHHRKQTFHIIHRSRDIDRM